MSDFCLAFLALFGVVAFALLFGWFTAWIEEDDRRHARERHEDESADEEPRP